jgi:hypothetical protein
MTWWLIGILGYLVALGVVLILAGGVRRSDESQGSAQRDLESANRDLDAREGRLRPPAPPRTAAHLQEARRAAGS